MGAWRIDADRKGGKNSDIFGIEKEGYHLHRRRTVGGARVRFGDRSGVGADAGVDRLRGSCGFLRGEKNQMEIPWRQITCIGDDVILVSPGSC